MRPTPRRAPGGRPTCAWDGVGRWGACGLTHSWASTTCSTGPMSGRWLSTRPRGAIMSPLPAATCTSGFRSVQGNRLRPSTEVGMRYRARWSATPLVAALVAAPLCGQGSGGVSNPGIPPSATTVVTNAMLANAAASGDWLMYGHDYWNNRFSPLKTINTTNVRRLVARAVYTHGSTQLGSFETTPIVVNGTMYITSPATPNNIVRAFDLRTQKMLWEYTHKNGPVSTACCGPNNRGVAVSGGSVFVGTLDDELVALDAVSGKEKWAVKVGDGPEAGYTETMTPAYDEATKTLFVAIGNPSPDLDGSIRPGDNRWTESVVAIDATNGKFKWGYQEVPHDVWDLDAVSPPVIAMVGGKKAVVEAGKTGFVYVLDAATGRLIRRSQAFVPQQNMYTQPTAEGVFMLPGANGGEEWSPIAVHPDLAYAYTVALHQPMHYKVHYAPWEKGRLWLGSAFVRVPDEKGGYSGEYGLVSAIDLNTGKIAWQQKTELPMMGGATATAGGLVFTGEGNGWFKAYDAKTGTVLWKFYCGAGVNAAPSVYELDGEQFIAVAAGGNFQISYPLGNSVFVFGLPKAGM